jgi:hypothetical protein
MCQNFIILYLYEAQHVSGDTPPIIRGLKLHWQPLILHTWKVVGSVVSGHCATTRPTTFYVCKTRGCQCCFRLLMMGGVSPETCWASHKYGIIKFWYIVASCWIFLYELWSTENFLCVWKIYITFAEYFSCPIWLHKNVSIYFFIKETVKIYKYNIHKLIYSVHVWREINIVKTLSYVQQNTIFHHVWLNASNIHVIKQLTFVITEWWIQT